MSAEFRLMIVRHAIALDREDARWAGIGEAQRPLTEKGRKRMRAARDGLRGLVDKLGIIASSPYARAAETADLLAEGYPQADRAVLDELRPGGDPEALLAWLRGQPGDRVVAVVGHEPDLGMLVSYALTAEQRCFVSMKKAGACLVCFADGVRAGRGELAWLTPPRVLRRLAGGDD